MYAGASIGMCPGTLASIRRGIDMSKLIGCDKCEKEFKTENGAKWHRENMHREVMRRAPEPAETPPTESGPSEAQSATSAPLAQKSDEVPDLGSLPDDNKLFGAEGWRKKLGLPPKSDHQMPNTVAELRLRLGLPKDG